MVATVDLPIQPGPVAVACGVIVDDVTLAPHGDSVFVSRHGGADNIFLSFVTGPVSSAREGLPARAGDPVTDS